MKNKKNKRKEKIEEKRKEIESYNQEIIEKKNYLKTQNLNKNQKAIIKKEIRELKRYRFGVKHPVLSIGRVIIESFGDLFTIAADSFNNHYEDVKQSYSSLDDRQKGIATITTLKHPLAGHALIKEMAKQNKKKALTGLKDQTKDKGKGMDY
jgi:hypothetical protein